ncbi:c-type cytochrome [Persephonella sp.]
MKKSLVLLIFLPVSALALDGRELFHRYNCSSCHAPDRRVVGPSFLEISKRYGTSEKAVEKVAKLIINPKPENWPGMAYMPPFNISMEEAKALARYVLIDSLEEIKEEKKKQTADDFIYDDMQFH